LRFSKAEAPMDVAVVRYVWGKPEVLSRNKKVLGAFSSFSSVVIHYVFDNLLLSLPRIGPH
jgi:hypothetical protein